MSATPAARDSERVAAQLRRIREAEAEALEKQLAADREKDAADRCYRWLRRKIEGKSFRTIGDLVTFALRAAHRQVGPDLSDAQLRRIGSACRRLWTTEPTIHIANAPQRVA